MPTPLELKIDAADLHALPVRRPPRSSWKSACKGGIMGVIREPPRPMKHSTFNIFQPFCEARMSRSFAVFICNSHGDLINLQSNRHILSVFWYVNVQTRTQGPTSGRCSHRLMRCHSEHRPPWIRYLESADPQAVHPCSYNSSGWGHSKESSERGNILHHLTPYLALLQSIYFPLLSPTNSKPQCFKKYPLITNL